MNKKVLIISAVCGILFFSCGKDKKESKTSEAEKPKTEKSEKVDLNATETKSEVVFADTVANKVYQQYLLVKKGLVNADNAYVREEAKKMELAIPENEMLKQLKYTANLIALNRDIKKQRDFFKTLTEETEKLIGNATISSGEVYKQFCPMAFEGEGGYWLSDSKEVRNPYYGDKMLKCGKVDQVIGLGL